MLLPVKDTKDKKNKEIKETKENALTNIKWDRIIFDEAHHLRNKRTERFSSCEKIQGKIKWLISGTPIQNKRSDLYNLFKIIGIDKVNQENVKEFAEQLREEMMLDPAFRQLTPENQDKLIAEEMKIYEEATK